MTNTTMLADLQHMLNEEWEAIPHQRVTRKLEEEEEEEVPSYFRFMGRLHSPEYPESFTNKQILGLQTPVYQKKNQVQN